MKLLRQIEERIYDMERATKAFNIEPFDIFFLGGAACILGQYTTRATRAFDFIDLDYSSELGKAFVQLRDFDMLEYRSTILSPKYKDRATKLDNFKYINVYILSPEDIVVSKIIRLEEKDVEDIDKIMKVADRDLINNIIDEVFTRDDLYMSKKEQFLKMLPRFRKRYHV